MPIGYTFCCICSRCGHEWVPKQTEQLALPRVCPRCKNPNWNDPRRETQRA